MSRIATYPPASIIAVQIANPMPRPPPAALSDQYSTNTTRGKPLLLNKLKVAKHTANDVPLVRERDHF